MSEAQEKLENLSISIPEYPWNRFKTTGENPPPNRYGTTVVYEGKVIFYGGILATKKTNEHTYVLDLDEKTWHKMEVTGKVPPPRCGHTAVVHGDCMYVFGGSPDSKHQSYNDFYVLNLKTKEWSEIIKENENDVWPSPRYHHSAVVGKNKMFVFGGSPDISNHMNDFYSFDFDTKKWNLIKEEGNPSVRSGHLSFVLEDRYVYIFGGFYGKGGYDTTLDLHRFDIENNKWSEVECKGTLPFPNRPLTGVVDENNIVYVYGGYNGKTPLRSLVEYHPKESTWVTAKLWMDLDEDSIASAAVGTKGMEPTPRYGHCLSLRNKVITIFAGSGSTYLNDVQQIDLDSE